MPDNLPPFNGALSGVKVVDCTQIMAGPFCTLLLADMGADVIKVEKPNGGDDARRLRPPFIQDWSAAFLAVNRNKRSIALDLRTEEGKKSSCGWWKRPTWWRKTSVRAPWAGWAWGMKT